MKKNKKQRFQVSDNETIEQCLIRMDKEGYTPIRRIEEPIFQEVIKNGKTEIEVAKQQIIFEGKLKDER